MSEVSPYDPAARRATPLALKLQQELIGATLPLDVYMQRCLFDPTDGYYATHPGIGADFTTAPEISQVFGELIGLWTVAVWQIMGQPSAIRLVEIGPGRGTMMRDMLRAARVLPGFLASVQVDLVETSPVLTKLQATTLTNMAVPKSWHTAITPASIPTVVVANELFDCVPVIQAVSHAGGWHERHVTIENGQLEFTIVPATSELLDHLDAHDNSPDGTVVQIHSFDPVAAAIATCADAAPLACLIMDYGHHGHPAGDTLQAVRRHVYEHPLTSPGEADLTTHVPFGALTDAFSRAGSQTSLTLSGPVTQAEFLGRLGIVERTARLMSANPALAGALEAATARLISPNAMGTRFKVLGVHTSGIAPLPGF